MAEGCRRRHIAASWRSESKVRWWCNRIILIAVLMAVSGVAAFNQPPPLGLRPSRSTPAGHDRVAWAARRRGLQIFAPLRVEGTGGAGVSLLAKKRAVDRDDPEYKAVLARQKLLTEAMDILTKYDEAQADFQALYSDSNAPLGDWCGYYKRLTAAERVAMRDACKVLASEASYVLIGLNAEDLRSGRSSMEQWISGLDLPMPDRVPYTDDTLRREYDDTSEMPQDLRELFVGPIHMCYNSAAGADEETGDYSDVPPAAHVMPYPAGDRGVVFTPILDGFFTQYGDVPLDLFDVAADAMAPTAEEADAEVQQRTRQSDPDIATKQHAALGNPMAAKILSSKQNLAPGEDYGMAPSNTRVTGG